MYKMRSNIAFLLLAIYGIVFAHNVIPHHHHMDMGAKMVAMFCQDDETHHHHDEHGVYFHEHENGAHNSGECLSHEHENEEHAACHFDVRPVAAKFIDFIPFLVVNSDFLLPLTVKENPKYEIDYRPYKLPEGYNYAVPLRAPPFFA